MKKNYSFYALLLLSFLNANTLKPAQAEEEPAQQAPSEISGFYCGHCQNAFLKLSDLRSHENSEKIPLSTEFYCSTCDYTSQHSSRLTTHFLTHTRERPFKCDMCAQSFTQSTNLRRHTIIHTGEKLFKCNLCPDSFAQKSTLIDHEKTHTGERPFKCTMCPKTFIQKSHLRVHKRCHTGEKPFKCDMCEKTFTQSSSLIEHKRIHTGEKPFKCDICQKAFSNLSNFTRHQKKHPGDKLYKCHVCIENFASLGNLKRHEKSETHIRNLDILHNLIPPPYCPLTPLLAAPPIQAATIRISSYPTYPDADSDQDSEYASDDYQKHPGRKRHCPQPAGAAPAPYPAPYNPELNKDNEDPELIALIENDLPGNQTAEEYIQNLTPTKFPSSIMLSKELTLLGGIPAKSESAFDYQSDSDDDNDHDSKPHCPQPAEPAPAPYPAPYKK